MTVEYETTSYGLERGGGISTLEKDQITTATRVSISNLEIAYPFLDHIEKFQESTTSPLAVLPLLDSEQSMEGSLKGVALHTAQMLGFVFSRHNSFVSAEEDLKPHFPTYPGEGLEVMAQLANEVTKNHYRSSRLTHIYDAYVEQQGALFEDSWNFTRKELLNMWLSNKTKERAHRYLENIYSLYNNGKLLVSHRKTVMQFEVAMIPRFVDLMIQSPMSIDMVIKVPGHAIQFSDLKVGKMPDIESEVSKHQRYLMSRALAQYSQYFKDDDPLYFGSPILFNNMDAIPTIISSMPPFFYTKDKFIGMDNNFSYFPAAIKDQEVYPVYDSLRRRAFEINDNKELIKTLFRISRKTSYKFPRSIFRLKKESNTPKPGEDIFGQVASFDDWDFLNVA